ncbi:hypothetical protein CFP56_007885 [Quercus suber]|uniref:Ureidoglycolate hydrolase n=1 Tax=Quercus suber TaxID=58331 RepID=A0AAW0L5Z8_QUESU
MGDSKAKPEVVEVKAIEATTDSFEEYGQVIEASPDGDEFGPQDAQLDLSRVSNLNDSLSGLYSIKDDTGGNNEIVQSRCGHFYVPPAVESVRVFRVEGSKFLKLNRGTWHAGPLFKADTMDFYNLELSNTNVVDHTTHNFKRENGVAFLIND